MASATSGGNAEAVSGNTAPQPSIDKLAAAAVGTDAAMRYLDPACIVVATDRLVAKDKPDAPSLVRLRTALLSPGFAPWTEVEELADTVGIVNGTGGSGKTCFMLTARPPGVETLVTFFVVAGDVARWIKNCHCSADEWSTMAPLLHDQLACSEALGTAVREALVAAVSDAAARLANGAEIGTPASPDAAAAVRVRVAIDDASECPALTSAVMTQQAAIRDAVRRVCKLPPSSHVDLMVGGRGILGRSEAISICADERFKMF